MRTLTFHVGHISCINVKRDKSSNDSLIMLSLILEIHGTSQNHVQSTV